jgi:hypothetical protein
MGQRLGARLDRPVDPQVSAHRWNAAAWSAVLKPNTEKPPSCHQTTQSRATW